MLQTTPSWYSVLKARASDPRRLPTRTKYVARLMRDLCLAARLWRRERVTATDSNQANPIAQNRLARRFDIHRVALYRVCDAGYHGRRLGASLSANMSETLIL